MRVLAVCIFVIGVTAGSEWPQWGGPERTFRTAPAPQISTWPVSGPKQLWARTLGDGYSSFVVADDVVITMYRKGTQDVVIAMDAASGKTNWEVGIDAPHRPEMNIEAGPGPHSTPLIAGGRLFVTTVIGQLVALDLKTGKRIWSRDLWQEYKGNPLERGYSASPMSYKDLVIVPVGGPGRALMAFRQIDGTVAWAKGDFAASNSSPILIRAAGRDQVVAFMARDVVGAGAESGEVLWSIPHKTMYDINAATPVWCEDSQVLVVSSAYDGGARGIQIKSTARELWHHRRFRVHHGNMVCSGGVVYGSNGDFGPAPLTAVEATTGKILWQDRAFSKATFVMAGDRLFLVDDDGSVAIASVSRAGLKVIAEAQLLRANSWTLPVVSGSRFFVRDRHQIITLALE